MVFLCSFALEMQENIRGIVLRTVKYGDTSLIVDLFTESHGRCSFMTSYSRGRRHSGSSAFWSPLSMVEFQADMHSSTRLPRPKDVRLFYVYGDMPYSPLKSTISLFLAEFLSAALREEHANAPLFQYLQSSLLWLDHVALPGKSQAVANFHLVFLMHLSRFIGIYPNLEFDPNGMEGKSAGHIPSYLFFDLLAGTYCMGRPPHPHFLSNDEARQLPLLFRMNYFNMHLFRFSQNQRRRCLEVLNTYYRLHVPLFPELKSIEVLHDVFC